MKKAEPPAQESEVNLMMYTAQELIKQYPDDTPCKIVYNNTGKVAGLILDGIFVRAYDVNGELKFAVYHA